MSDKSQSPQREAKTVDLIQSIYIIHKWRKLILMNTLIVAILAVILSLVMSKTYIASAKIMPSAEEQGLLAGLPMKIPNLMGLKGLVGGGSNDIFTLIAILNSRTVSEKVINKFNLIDRFESDNIDEALYTFGDYREIEIDDEGMVRISAMAKTGLFHPEEEEEEARQLAADIANYMVAELNRINSGLRSKQARYNREFLERRFEENKADLAEAEVKLKDFGEKYGVVALPEQVEALVTAGAQIETQMLIKEIELASLREYLDSQNPQIQLKSTELQEMRKKLRDLMSGKNLENRVSTFPSFEETPQLGLQYLRLKRELEVQTLLYEFLAQQYEQAKLEETKDTPTLMVIDHAVPPVLRSSPQRKLLVILLTMMGFFLSVGVAFVLEFGKDWQQQFRERFYSTSK